MPRDESLDSRPNDDGFNCHHLRLFSGIKLH